MGDTTTANPWIERAEQWQLRAEMLEGLLERAKEYVHWSQRAGFVQLVAEIDAALAADPVGTISEGQLGK